MTKTSSNKKITIAVLVNGATVTLHKKKATGAEIKLAAINTGVPIKLDFVLREVITDNEKKIIRDDQEVHLTANIEFTAKRKKIVIFVNEQPVKIASRIATGFKIKSLAIRQGVLIQPNFVLQEELPNGTSRIVGDTDRVHIHEHMKFTAIAPDDNS